MSCVASLGDGDGDGGPRLIRKTSNSRFSIAKEPQGKKRNKTQSSPLVLLTKDLQSKQASKANVNFAFLSCSRWFGCEKRRKTLSFPLALLTKDLHSKQASKANVNFAFL